MDANGPLINPAALTDEELAKLAWEGTRRCDTCNHRSIYGMDSRCASCVNTLAYLESVGFGEEARKGWGG